MNRWDGVEFISLMKLDGTKSVLEIVVGTGRLARNQNLYKKFGINSFKSL